MTIQTNLNDRKELARRLIPFNHNEKLHYTGTPAFAYEGQASASFAAAISNAMMKRQKPPSRFPAGSRNPSAAGTGRRNRNRSNARIDTAG